MAKTTTPFNRGALLAMRPAPTGSVDIPGAGTLWFKPLSAGDAMALADAVTSTGGAKSEQTVDMVIKSACDADGAPQFEASDAPALLALPNDIWRTMLDTCMAVNGFGAAKVEAAKGN